MYDFLRGAVASLDAGGQLSLEVGGVGYLLRISEHTRSRLPLDGSTVRVYTRLVVREDDLLLFGFGDPAERVAFDLLTGVQGVGPGVALAILSRFAVAELRQVLARKDALALKSVKGVGTKSAERITLELSDKLSRIPVPQDELPAEDLAVERQHGTAADEARQALVALGFSHREAIDTLARIAEPEHDAAHLLRKALVLLRGGA